MKAIEKTKAFAGEVREEIGKCTRPTAAELRESTAIIVFTMVVIGVFIFAFDMAITRALNLIISH